MFRCFRFISSLVLLALLAACAPTTTRTAGPIRVVATLAPAADWARAVGGERVVVTQLVAAGRDPRSYALTDADQAALANAEVLLLHGLGLEPWLERWLESNPTNRLIVIDLAQFVAADITTQPRPRSPLDLDNEFSQSALEAAPRSDPTLVYSPYVWLDPSKAQQSVNVLAQLFARTDRDGWPIFRHNAARYNAEVDNLANRIQRTFDALPPRAWDDLNGFSVPFRQRFDLVQAPVVTATSALTPHVLLDRWMPSADQASLLGARSVTATLDPLNNEQYPALLETFTQQLLLAWQS